MHTARHITLLADSTPATDVKSTSDTEQVTAPPPLMEDCKDTLYLMQKTNPFCKCILKMSTQWQNTLP